jgi:hypothetical protein
LPRPCCATQKGADIWSAFNQVSVEYNTTKGEKVEKLKEVMAAREKKYKTIM